MELERCETWLMWLVDGLWKKGVEEEVKDGGRRKRRQTLTLALAMVMKGGDCELIVLVLRERERESAFTFGPSATCPCCGYQGLKGISTSTTTLTSNATLEGNGRHNNKGEYSKPPPYCLSLLVLIKSRGTKMKRAFCFNVWRDLWAWSVDSTSSSVASSRFSPFIALFHHSNVDFRRSPTMINHFVMLESVFITLTAKL